MLGRVRGAAGQGRGRASGRSDVPGAPRAGSTMTSKRHREVTMRRAVTVSLSAIGLTAALALPAAASGAPTTKRFTEVESGTRLSAHGNKYEDLYKIKRSPDG